MATRKRKRNKSKFRKRRLQTKRRHFGGHFFRNRCTQKEFDKNGPEAFQRNCCLNKWYNRYNFYNRDSAKRLERCNKADTMINAKIDKRIEENKKSREDKIKKAYLEADKYAHNKNTLNTELYSKTNRPSFAIIKQLLDDGLNPNDGFEFDRETRYGEAVRSTQFMSALFHKFNLNDTNGRNPSEAYYWKTPQENLEKIMNLIKIANLFVRKGYKPYGSITFLNAIDHGEYLKVWYLKNKFPEIWDHVLSNNIDDEHYKNIIKMMEPQWKWLDENVGTVEDNFN